MIITLCGVIVKELLQVAVEIDQHSLLTAKQDQGARYLFFNLHIVGRLQPLVHGHQGS